MPRYRIRLNDPDSNEFRVYMVHADTEGEAIAVVKGRERRAVAWQMDPVELAALVAREAGEPLDDSEMENLTALSLRGEDPSETLTMSEQVELSTLQAREQGLELSRSERGRLHTHRQHRPYEVSTVQEGGSIRELINLKGD